MLKRQQKQKLGLQGLEQETEYLNFINLLRSKATIEVYRRAIIRFINIIKASSLIKQDTKTIEQQLISYLVDQRINQKLSYAILSVRLAALRKFYDMNDVA